MDTFNAADLRGLLNDASEPCVSIYLPTHVAAPDHHQNPVRLKNLLREAEKRLPADAEGSRDLLRPAWERLDDKNFWKGRSAGLAIFASANRFRSFRLPINVPEVVEVGAYFVLRPLFPLLTDNSRCLVLALSRNHVRLFEATQYEIRDVTPVTMPTELESALNTDQVDRGAQSHSAMQGSHGKQGAVFHGQGGQVDTIKDETGRFFQLVDGSLRGRGDDRGLPLILAGVDSDVALFRSITQYPHVADKHASGNMDRRSAQEIHQCALPVIASLSSKQRQAAMSRLRELNRGRVSNSIRDILPASHQGRIDALFVRTVEPQWGIFFPDNELVEPHGTRQPGDQDLLEVTAFETAVHGGMVFTVEAEDLPDNASIAAIYRY